MNERERRRIESFSAIWYYELPDKSNGVTTLYLCKNKKRALNDIEKRYPTCPICGEEIDNSEQARKANETDEYVLPWIDTCIEHKGEPRYIRGLPNGNLIFRYLCGHKLAISAAGGTFDSLPEDAQKTMFVKSKNK